MRVFIDACIDPRTTELFAAHDVKTAFDLGWHKLKDHVVLTMVCPSFDVFVTADKGFEFEHNLRALPIAIVIVHVAKNKVEFYRELAGELRAAVNNVRPGTVVHVPAQ